MCLGIPGRIVEIHDTQGLSIGVVDFGGVRGGRGAADYWAPPTRASLVSSCPTNSFAKRRRSFQSVYS